LITDDNYVFIVFAEAPSFSEQAVMNGYQNKPFPEGKADTFSFGALSIGFRGYRAGWNSEKIRNLFQNKFAHSEHRILGMKLLHNQPYFRNLGGSGSFYSQSSNFGNPYSLWSF